ncbi:hypothetical protein KIN20_024415 [Parelaphostrongylus tenuis]|uniref:Uncharacterized protein n=1 Tax=Parelaphostrongylus tenuis TaxID=148309 RepID=A0AAD5NCT7_PARTN|nr:hypothetical protein KIN20_015048 [Parelaphostrongylus tenuis]KAJ1364334.1 hypothetical protein KIN20_024415 [Parelaphostrongylus tenuis]
MDCFRILREFESSVTLVSECIEEMFTSLDLLVSVLEKNQNERSLTPSDGLSALLQNDSLLFSKPSPISALSMIGELSLNVLRAAELLSELLPMVEMLEDALYYVTTKISSDM